MPSGLLPWPLLYLTVYVVRWRVAASGTSSSTTCSCQISAFFSHSCGVPSTIMVTVLGSESFIVR